MIHVKLGWVSKDYNYYRAYSNMAQTIVIHLLCYNRNLPTVLTTYEFLAAGCGRFC